MHLVADSLRVQEDEDNDAIIQSARDALKLVRNKYLPAVCTWAQVSASPAHRWVCWEGGAWPVL